MIISALAAEQTSVSVVQTLCIDSKELMDHCVCNLLEVHIFLRSTSHTYCSYTTYSFSVC